MKKVRKFAIEPVAGMRGKPAFLQDSSGAAAVEFAIVTPIFLLIAAGILFYGVYFGARHSTAQIAADAARASVAGLTDTERAEIAIAHVTRTASEYPLISFENITVTASPAAGDSSLFRVEVRYDTSALPIAAFGELFPLPSRTIVQTAVIKRGGF